MKPAVEIKNVSKLYKLYSSPNQRLRELVTLRKLHKPFYALNDVSFNINHGEILGIIGKNGSGKSTLANLIAGIGKPTKGDIILDGTASMIAIGAGLDLNLTGKENIVYKLLLLGFTKQEIKKLIPKIIDFSDLGAFINQPVKTYSSGMRSKLGFSISININPDILVVDEALSVGDEQFSKKSYNAFMKYKDQKKTIIFISHNLPQVRSFCDRAVWLNGGKLMEEGTPEEVTRAYNLFIKNKNNLIL